MNKKPPRRVLGKGLSSLIPAAGHEEKEEIPGEKIAQINPSLIRANPFQPRRYFNDDEIQSLADSIQVQGLLQPILVRQKENDTFEIISGERRFRALQRLGWEKIPCVVKRHLPDRDMMEMALVENIQREDLNEIEKAEAYQKLIQEYEYTHEQLSRQVGKSRTAVTNTLRLLGLPEEIRQMVRENRVTMGHARALLSIDDNEKRLSLAKRILAEDLTVREIEKAVQPVEKGKTRKPSEREAASPALDPDIAAALGTLEYRLGTAVRLKYKTEKAGTIEIAYFSESDLTRIFDVLLKVKETVSGE